MGVAHSDAEVTLDDEPIPYMARTRAYYGALGYTTAYHWAHYPDVPFTLLDKALASSRIALVTTAAPYQPGKGDQGPGAPYNGAAKFFSVYSFGSDCDPDLRISHVAIDRAHTTAEDIGTWFPGEALRRAVARARVGSVAPRFHGLPTNRSQRITMEIDAPTLVQRCIDDSIDAAILVPNCPVCHQSCAIAARALEAAGVPTVVMGCARDIVEHVGVARFLFSDFPLGNAAGRPHDRPSQDATLELALGLLETAKAPRTTLRSHLRWSDDASWKLDYCNVDRLSEAELRRLREGFDAAKAAAEPARMAAKPAKMAAEPAEVPAERSTVHTR